METPGGGGGDGGEAARWVDGEIDLPEGAAELDEEAIQQIRMLYADEIMRQYPHLTPDELLIAVDQAVRQVVSEINHTLAADGFTEEIDTLTAVRLRPNDPK
jgi:hypothetical protein